MMTTSNWGALNEPKCSSGSFIEDSAHMTKSGTKFSLSFLHRSECIFSFFNSEGYTFFEVLCSCVEGFFSNLRIFNESFSCNCKFFTHFGFKIVTHLLVLLRQFIVIAVQPFMQL